MRETMLERLQHCSSIRCNGHVRQKPPPIPMLQLAGKPKRPIAVMYRRGHGPVIVDPRVPEGLP